MLQNLPKHWFTRGILTHFVVLFCQLLITKHYISPLITPSMHQEIVILKLLHLILKTN